MELQKFVAIVDILMLVAAVIVFWMLLWPRKSPIARLPVPDWNNEPLALLDIQSMHPNSVIMSNVFGITQETSTRMSELCQMAFDDTESLVYGIDIPETGIDKGVAYVRGPEGSEQEWNPDPKYVIDIPYTESEIEEMLGCPIDQLAVVPVPEDVDIPDGYVPSHEEVTKWLERYGNCKIRFMGADLAEGEEISCEDTETGD